MSKAEEEANEKGFLPSLLRSRFITKEVGWGQWQEMRLEGWVGQSPEPLSQVKVLMLYPEVHGEWQVPVWILEMPWQCGRASEASQRLRGRGPSPGVRDRTGGHPDSAT